MKKHITSIIPGVLVADPVNYKLYCITYNQKDDQHFYLFDLSSFTLYNDYLGNFKFTVKELQAMFRFHKWELVEKNLTFQLSELRQFEVITLNKKSS